MRSVLASDADDGTRLAAPDALSVLPQSATRISLFRCRIFAAIAGPLFLAGVWLGYVTLPKGLEILIGFNPDGVTNLVDLNEYLTFFSRTLIVFGIAFEIPLFVVLLKLAGVVSGKALGNHRPWIIVGTFLFAAIATPSADPFTMTFMAVPMVILFLVSEQIARFNDRRRDKKRKNAGLSPDELSVLWTGARTRRQVDD